MAAAVEGGFDQEVLIDFLRVNHDLFPRDQVEAVLSIFGAEPLQEEAMRVEAAAQPNFFVPDRRFLFYNMLSTQWTWSRCESNPAMYPALYIFGMVAYALALPIRVVILVITVLRLAVGSLILCCAEGSYAAGMKERGWVFLGALGEVGSGIIGIFCPPAAYALDERIQNHPTIHQWYRSHNLSLWNDELESNLNGNAERVALKKTAIRADGDQFFFKRAKETLADRYLSPGDEVDALSPVALNLITHFGFLDLFCQFWESGEARVSELEELEGLQLKKYFTAILDKKSEEQRPQQIHLLLGYLNEFGRLWWALKKSENADVTPLVTPLVSPRNSPRSREPVKFNGKSATMVRAMQASLVLLAGGDYHDAGTEEKLKAILLSLETKKVVVDGQEITHRAAVERMASIIKNFSETVKTTDREMEGVIMKSAYEVV